MDLRTRFVDLALSYVGAPYIWGGKGNLLFRDGKLLKSPLAMPVFDCSGLVTACLFQATQGKIDLIGTHSAQTIWDTFPESQGEASDGTLRLYEGHVAISLGRSRVVEAAGGDHTTLTVEDAADRNARVMAHVSNRSGLLGYRRIPLDLSELRII
jgi:cell wall-associated NlpC family hydrolase